MSKPLQAPEDRTIIIIAAVVVDKVQGCGLPGPEWAMTSSRGCLQEAQNPD